MWKEMCYMKKYLSFMLAVLFLFSAAMPVRATDSSITLKANAAALKQGDTFTVTAALTASQTAALGTVKLEYDSNGLTLIGGTCLIPNTDIGLVAPEKNAGTFLFRDGAQVVSGDLFAFTFTVKEEAPLESFTISSSATMGDASISSVNAGSLTLTVAIPSPGDVNGDFQVNNKDVFHLLWYLLFTDDYTLFADGDVNRDGTLNNKDVIYLLWHTLFTDTYPL